MKFYDDVLFLMKRLWSVRFAAIGIVWAAAGSAWLVMPSEWKPDLSQGVRWLLVVVSILLAAAPGLAALVKQPKLKADLEARK